MDWILVNVSGLLASSLMKTAFTYTVFIAQAILIPN